MERRAQPRTGTGMDSSQDQQPTASSFESAFDVGAETLAYQIVTVLVAARMPAPSPGSGGEAVASRSLLGRMFAWLGFGS